MKKFLWKIGGEAGFGIMTSGLAVSKLATRSGYHIFDYAEYPSLIRGGHNTYEVLISDEEVHATKHDIDMLVCLNKASYALHKERLNSQSLVIYDPEMFEIDQDVVKIQVPLKAILKELTGPQLMMNTIALGTTMGMMKGDPELLYSMIEEQFAKKGEEVVTYNKNFAKKGYEYVTQHYGAQVKDVLSKKSDREKVVITANEAFSLGAVAADCRFYAAYPMTPTSAVLSILAGWQTTTGMVVKHAEDEIAVINMALGASHSGVRASVGTSGGGFALMVEGISYAGIAEIPIVIFLGQRPGPATGMPTWTEQGDLLFATQAGHGEFPKMVLAAGDVKEMIDLTQKAFNLAEVYQTPVIIMGDKLICESHKSEYRDEITNVMVNYHLNKGKTVSEPSEKPYLRYKMTDDGISERLIPGDPGSFYQANSYEHAPDSHTTEDAQPRIDQVDKRNKKWETYFAHDFVMPTLFGDQQSNIVFVSWGGNKGAILEAQKELKNQGITTGYMHFTHVYPLSKEKLQGLFSPEKRYILVENNSHGQFGKVLQMETGIEMKEKILKYDGRPIWTEELVQYVLSHR